jgi:hypothetical protein
MRTLLRCWLIAVTLSACYDARSADDGRAAERRGEMEAEQVPGLPRDGVCPANFDSEDQAPIVPSLPSPPMDSQLPADCDETAARERALAACGAVQEIEVNASLKDALASCQSGRFCHVMLPEGDFVGGATQLRCTFIEGAGAARTRIAIQGESWRTSEHVIFARVGARSADGVFAADRGPFLANEVDFVGGYQGGSISWDGTGGGIHVCRSTVRGGYEGLGLSWHSVGMLIAGSSVGGCYNGLNVSWESSQALVFASHVFGGYAAVSADGGSHHITVQDNELVSPGGDGWPGAAVLIDDTTSAVEVLDNDVISGMLPAANVAANVVVEGNELR